MRKTITTSLSLLILLLACLPAGAQDCADYTGPAHFADRINSPSAGPGLDTFDLRTIGISWPYALAGGFGVGFTGSYFHVIDLTAPDGSQVVGFLSEFNTGVFDMDIVGSLVYGAHDHLRIIDWADPSEPTVVGQVDLPGYGWGVSVVDASGMAFAACQDSGLVAVDVSDPTNPSIVGSLVLANGEKVRDVKVDSGFAYIITQGSEGFRVVDISDPAAMVPVASLPVRGYGLAVEDGYAYAVINNGTSVDDGLRIIDVSAPLSPVVVGSITGYDLKTVTVSDGLAYADKQIFDVSDPTNPVFVRLINLTVASPATSPVAVHEGVIYTASGDYGIEVGSPDGGGAQAPAAGEIADYLVYGMRFRDDLGYVFGNRDTGLGFHPLFTLYDVANPAAPQVLGTLLFPDASHTTTIDGDGSTAFLTQPYVLTAVDISNPAVPAVTGSLVLDYRPEGSWLDGTHLYLTDPEYTDRGLRVYDVSDPSAMTEIGYLPLEGLQDNGLDVEVSGNFAFVPRGYSQTTEASGLDIVDISDPTSPTLAATVPFPYTAWSVALDGDYAWVGYGFSNGGGSFRLAAVDVSDPLAPFVAHDLGLPLATMDIAIAGDHLYTASRFSGPAVVDISDPLQARTVGCMDPDHSYGFRVATAGNHAYVGSWLGNGSVRIFEPQCSAVSAVESPTLGPLVLRNYPNPFNPLTTVHFELPRSSPVTMTVHDLAGRRVRVLIDERDYPAGSNSATWDGRDESGWRVPSGIYFAKIRTNEWVKTRKMTLLK